MLTAQELINELILLPMETRKLPVSIEIFKDPEYGLVAGPIEVESVEVKADPDRVVIS